jgi:translation initiation factor IF-3
LIGPNGENVGVVSMKQALQIARDAEMDVVEVSPNAAPPVCRVMDFGKFIYERAKKEKEAKKAQTKIEVKEIRLRPKTNEAHRGFKVDDARRWLLAGNKVRVTIKFRGREMDYPEIALEDLKEIAAALADVSVVEASPQMEGRTMLVVLAPNKVWRKRKRRRSKPPLRKKRPKRGLKSAILEKVRGRKSCPRFLLQIFERRYSECLAKQRLKVS